MVDKSAFVTDVWVGDFMRRDKNYVSACRFLLRRVGIVHYH